jgi:hypothetical protein
VHVTGFDPVQTPAVHVSVCVQGLPSLQVVPFGSAGLEHAPDFGSQVPAAWHGSLAVQTTGLDPVQTPAWQVSVCVQGLLSLQAVLFATFDHAVVVAEGVQTWQALAGFTVPAGKRAPPMKQSATQLVPLQTWPLPQLVPVGSVDQVVVEVPGAHSWQAFRGFTVPLA